MEGGEGTDRIGKINNHIKAMAVCTNELIEEITHKRKKERRQRRKKRKKVVSARK